MKKNICQIILRSVLRSCFAAVIISQLLIPTAFSSECLSKYPPKYPPKYPTECPNDKIEIVLEGGTLKQYYTENMTRDVLRQVPLSLRKRINKITLASEESQSNGYWRQLYNDPTFTTAASVNLREVHITIFPISPERCSSGILKENLIHEGAHILDWQLGGGKYFSDGEQWETAIAEDKKYDCQTFKEEYCVTQFAEDTRQKRKTNCEDFAESCEIFFENLTYFEKYFPNRAKIIKEVIPDWKEPAA